MFPLSTVLFPHGLLPLHVFEPRYRQMMKDCLDGDRTFGVVLISRGSEVGGGERRVSVGTGALIERISHLPDGRSLLLVQGTNRFRVREWMVDDPYPRGMVEWLPAPAALSDGANEITEALGAATAAVRRASALLSELEERSVGVSEIPKVRHDADARAWWLCEQLPLGALDRQRLLECEDVRARLTQLVELADSLSDDLLRLLAGG